MWAPACCAAWPRRDGPCARWRGDRSACPAWRPCAATCSGAGLEDALEGCETAYYLVHSMEPATGTAASRPVTGAWPRPSPRPRRRRRRADRLSGRHRAARPPPSEHLRSRLEVEEILLAAVPGSTALRASIVIGAGSSSFRVLVRLVERLRVLPLPRWRSNRTQPIDERDVIEFLARTPRVPEAAGRSLDVCGPDVMTYGEMIERIAEAMGVGRIPLGLTARSRRRRARWSRR